jgi:anti-sigma factor RsiW
MSGCRTFSTLLDAYSDGELSPEKAIEVDSHLLECGTCMERVRLDHATRLSVRNAVYAAAAPSDAFRERIAASMRAERERELAASQPEPAARRSGMLSWGTILPMAAAAGAVLTFSAITKTPTSRAPATARAEAGTTVTADVLTPEQILDQFVDYHVNPGTPAITEPKLLDQLDPEVGVPVRFPELANYGARWEGGDVVRLPLRGLSAASLRFRLDGHRVTLYVYNSERMPIQRRLRERAMYREPVYVGYKRGYSIAATERRGIGYAVATDLSDNESAELVASLH